MRTLSTPMETEAAQEIYTVLRHFDGDGQKRILDAVTQHIAAEGPLPPIAPPAPPPSLLVS